MSDSTQDSRIFVILIIIFSVQKANTLQYKQEG